MAAVTVSRRDDRLIAIKQVPAERAAEVEREAQLLERLAHPSVVRFVDLVETPDGGRALHTEFVSSHTWATRPLTDPVERAAAMASLAAVVADLHDSGLAHLRLVPGHVLHGEDDRPVLCGLARAGEASADNRHADLVALADLCHDDDVERGQLSGKLSSVADAARTGQISARDLARKLDRLLAKRAPRPEAPRRSRPDGPAAPRRLPRRAVYAAAALTLVAVSALAVAGWRGREPGTVDVSIERPAAPAAEHAQIGSVAGPSSEGTPAGSAGGTSLEPSSGEAPTGLAGGTAAHALDSDATHQGGPVGQAAARAGAPQQGESSEASDVASGPEGGSFPAGGSGPTPAESLSTPRPAAFAADGAAVLHHNGRRYAIGLAGDLVATGDWDCDGHATPAIVRPDTGDVVLFDAWPGPGETISMPVRWNVQAPTGAETVRHESCDLLRVLTAVGSRLLNPRSTQ